MSYDAWKSDGPHNTELMFDQAFAEKLYAGYVAECAEDNEMPTSFDEFCENNADTIHEHALFEAQYDMGG